MVLARAARQPVIQAIGYNYQNISINRAVDDTNVPELL